MEEGLEEVMGEAPEAEVMVGEGMVVETGEVAMAGAEKVVAAKAAETAEE